MDFRVTGVNLNTWSIKDVFVCVRVQHEAVELEVGVVWLAVVFEHLLAGAVVAIRLCVCVCVSAYVCMRVHACVRVCMCASVS